VTGAYGGPPGPQGNQGLTGPTGVIGVNGTQGTQGNQGTQGDFGPTGPASGPQGNQGSTGPAPSSTITNGGYTLEVGTTGILISTSGGASYGYLTVSGNSLYWNGNLVSTVPPP
jgi:hypothetical protein